MSSAAYGLAVLRGGHTGCWSQKLENLDLASWLRIYNWVITSVPSERVDCQTICSGGQGMAGGGALQTLAGWLTVKDLPPEHCDRFSKLLYARS